MGNAEKKSEKGSWFKGLRSEFSKIKWLDKKAVGRQTLTVAVVSVVVGLIIAIIDYGVQFGLNILVNM